MFQFIINTLVNIIVFCINNKLGFVRKVGYFIYEIKTDLLVCMYRRKSEALDMWEDADFSYVCGASLYYSTFESMQAYAHQCMEADNSWLPNVEMLNAPCGCNYTLNPDDRKHGNHKVICAMCQVHMEEYMSSLPQHVEHWGSREVDPEEEVGMDELYPEEECALMSLKMGKDRLRKTSTMRYEDMNRG